LDLDARQANDDGFDFRFADDLWIYNLSTKNLQIGTYFVTIGTPDGLRYRAAFDLR